MKYSLVGTGNPILTNGIQQQLLEHQRFEADILNKATKVDGVFNKDPNRFDDAIKLDKISIISH